MEFEDVEKEVLTDKDIKEVIEYLRIMNRHFLKRTVERMNIAIIKLNSRIIELESRSNEQRISEKRRK